jgi:lysozyme
MSSLVATLLSIFTLSLSSPNEISCYQNCYISDSGQALVRTFEGYSPFIYLDSAGLPTIGYGHLIKDGEKFIEPLLPAQANELLLDDLDFAVDGVNRHTKVIIKQNQADALISFTFNVGVGAYSRSTLLKKVNIERHDLVPEQFMRWVFAGGSRVQGLVNRRKAESELYQQ